MRLAATLFALLISISSAFAAELPEKDRTHIRASVESLMTHYNAGDIDALIKIMPPRAVRLFGGHKTLTRIILNEFRDDVIRNPYFETFTVGQISKPIMAGKTAVVFVLTEEAQTPENDQVHAKSFVIASREKGSDKWHFLRGNGIDRQKLTKIYPGFPPSAPLPPVKYEFRKDCGTGERDICILD